MPVRVIRDPSIPLVLRAVDPVLAFPEPNKDRKKADKVYNLTLLGDGFSRGPRG